MARAATERLEFRVRPDLKERIEHAAELAQVPVGEFVRQAAEERAEDVIRSHASTLVPARFFAGLMAALDRPVRANPVLARQARRARTVVSSR